MSNQPRLSVVAAIFSVLRGVWRLIPRQLRLGFWTLAGPGLQAAYARQLLARPAKRRPIEPSAPLVVAGLFSTANGIGEAARATYRALDAAGLSPIAVDLSAQLAPVDMVSDIECHPMPDAVTGTLILQLNAPETVAALQHLGMKRGRNWYTIGYWAWELPSFPKNWHRAFPFISELWAISQFVADALQQHPRTPPCFVFPHAVVPPNQIAENRQQFGWSDEQFVFLTMADSMSSLQRKNPFAAINAFKSTFGDDPSKCLIVKTRNLDRDLQAGEDLSEAIGDAKNIQILDVSMSDTQRWELIQAANAIVSLHRSEGFGLVLAEAMALGKPVIATNWSGNTDFTASETCFLVEAELVPCRDDYGVYQDENARWAEVIAADAQYQMELVATDADLRRKKARAAQDKMREWASSARIGDAMAKRLRAAEARD